MSALVVYEEQSTCSACMGWGREEARWGGGRRQGEGVGGGKGRQRMGSSNLYWVCELILIIRMHSNIESYTSCCLHCTKMVWQWAIFRVTCIAGNLRRHVHSRVAHLDMLGYQGDWGTAGQDSGARVWTAAALCPQSDGPGQRSYHMIQFFQPFLL